MKPVRICISCRYSFKPQFTNDELMDLLFDEEDQKKIDFYDSNGEESNLMAGGYYWNKSIPAPSALPVQRECENCIRGIKPVIRLGPTQRHS